MLLLLFLLFLKQTLLLLLLFLLFISQSLLLLLLFLLFLSQSLLLLLLFLLFLSQSLLFLLLFFLLFSQSLLFLLLFLLFFSQSLLFLLLFFLLLCQLLLLQFLLLLLLYQFLFFFLAFLFLLCQSVFFLQPFLLHQIDGILLLVIFDRLDFLLNGMFYGIFNLILFPYFLHETGILFIGLVTERIVSGIHTILKLIIILSILLLALKLLFQVGSSLFLGETNAGRQLEKEYGEYKLFHIGMYYSTLLLFSSIFFRR